MPISDYLRELRELVGHRYLLVPTAVALVFDDERRLLMVRLARPDELWGLPGGAIDPDERPADAAVRETREETGLDVRVVGIAGCWGGPEFRHTFPNGDEAGFVMTAFECEVVGGRAVADGDEVLELRWASHDEALAFPTPGWGSSVLPAAFDLLDR